MGNISVLECSDFGLGTDNEGQFWKEYGVDTDQIYPKSSIRRMLTQLCGRNWLLGNMTMNQLQNPDQLGAASPHVLSRFH